MESGPVLGFGLGDLGGVVPPHNDALVIRVTMTNNDMAWVFVDANISVNILFWVALE